MNVEDIPADDLMTMTARFVRGFKALGCDPHCHCCEKKIEVGMKFKLAFIKRPQYNILSGPDSADEMLCYHCTPAKLLALEKAARNASMERLRRGGFTRAPQDKG